MEWASFWVFVLWTALVIFGMVSLWVIVAGFGDIQRMFRDLREQREPEE